LFRSGRKKPDHSAVQYIVGLAGLVEQQPLELPMHRALVRTLLTVLFLAPAVIIAAVPQDPAQVVKGPGLSYTILSDARMAAARAYGVVFRVDDATAARYKGFGIDLEAASGETHHELPVPAVFIVDRSGVIRFVYANADYRIRLAPDELLAKARRLVQ